jgi:hypothetical protein
LLYCSVHTHTHTHTHTHRLKHTQSQTWTPRTQTDTHTDTHTRGTQYPHLALLQRVDGERLWQLGRGVDGVLHPHALSVLWFQLLLMQLLGLQVIQLGQLEYVPVDKTLLRVLIVYAAKGSATKLWPVLFISNWGNSADQP